MGVDSGNCERLDSNQRPSGYEPDELTKLLYSALCYLLKKVSQERKQRYMKQVYLCLGLYPVVCVSIL